MPLPKTEHEHKASQQELVGSLAHVLWSSPEGGAVIAKLKGGAVVKGSCPEHEELNPDTTYRFLGAGSGITNTASNSHLRPTSATSRTNAPA